MATTVKAGWLKDSQGNKFAPKTIASQVVRDDGTSLEDFIQNGYSTSWNDLQDRPFYETEPIETVIVPETTLSGLEEWGPEVYGALVCTSDKILKTGSLYDIIIDGTVYRQIECVSDNGCNTLGSTFAVIETTNPEYPFIIYQPSGDNNIYAVFKSNNNHTISVTGTISEIIPLERKYIAEYLDVIPGEKVSFKTYNVDGVDMIAAQGAEVFNHDPSGSESNIAIGFRSHAEGRGTAAIGEATHSEGLYTIASGEFSHTEGRYTKASYYTTHAEGESTEASGHSSHSEGYHTTASGSYSHSEGYNTTASEESSHAEGSVTTASGRYSHSEGRYTVALAESSHSEGYYTKAASKYQHAQGKFNIEDTSETYAHIVGNGSRDTERSNAHTLDWSGNAWFQGDVYVGGTGQTDTAAKKLSTVGLDTKDTVYTIDNESVTAGTGAEVFNDYKNNKASGKYSHAEGNWTLATGNNSHAEGYDTKATAQNAHAEGSMTTASGHTSHAEGENTTASGEKSHAEGCYSTAEGTYSHAEGYGSTASGVYSHAQGASTTASGEASHAEGNGSTASGENSHAEGQGTKASSTNQHVQGKYNVEDTAGTYAHIVGNGANINSRSNAHTLDWAGNAWFKGDVYIGGTDQSSGVKAASETWVIEQIQAAINASWEASY